MREQPAMGPLAKEFGEHPLHAAARHPDAEVLARHALDGVSLVENHDVVIGKQTRPRTADGKIGEVERMVDDQHLRVGHPTSGGVVVALLVGRAGAAHTVAGVAGHLVPDGVAGQGRQVGERAVGCVLGPRRDLEELGPLALVGKQAP